MLLAIKPGHEPMLVERVQTLVRGRKVVQVVEGVQPLAPGLAERVRLVMSEHECNERRLWN